MRKTTLAAIAAEAGVSLPTVSKVVNGRPDVSPTTRARVEQLLDRHKYPRNGPRLSRRSGLIDLVFNGLDSPWAVEILRGVEEWGAEQGTAIAVSSVRHGDARPASWTSTIASHHSDGVILVTTKLTETQVGQLRGAGIPLVVIDPANTPPADIPSVGATNWAGGFAATEHLLSPRPPADRRDHRSGRLPVQPGQARRLPVGPRAGGRRVRPGAGPVRRLPPRGRVRLRGRAARPAGPADGDLRGQRPAGLRRLRGRPPARAAHPRGPVRRRLRRAAGRPLGLAADDHRAAAAGRDGKRRRADARRADRRACRCGPPGWS